MTKEDKEIMLEIDNKIRALDIRISAGEYIVKQCKNQMRALKAMVREYNRVKQQIILSDGMADGDL